MRHNRQRGVDVPISTVHSFLVHAGKNLKEQPEIGGTKVLPKSQKLYSMLQTVYEKADVECTIDIAFSSSSTGEQQNDCRDLILAYIEKHEMAKARAIAERLQECTDQRSGLALLFVMVGAEGTQGNEHKLVIARFPADTAILADQKAGVLTVEFLERVFMKSASSYKSAVYRDKSLTHGFWMGKAVDRQINTGMTNLSTYWIKDFLASDFSTTSQQGSRRLAEALREAIGRATEVSTKEELIAASRLAGSLNDKATSIEEFIQHFGLSQVAKTLIAEQFRNREHLLEEKFQFDADEFRQHIPYRSIQMSSGGLLTAKTDEFDKAFRREEVKGSPEKVRFISEGTIVDDKLRKGRP
jgi:hypothetical protein